MYGTKGWIGSTFVRYLEDVGIEVIAGEARADDPSAVEAEIDRLAPDRVVAFIGRTHGPGFNTIDYLEQPGKLPENIRDNLFAPASLALVCSRKGVHFTYLGTGCIFSDADPTAVTHDESDLPNFFGSSYSVVKGFTDRFMHMFDDHALNVRIRMPITADDHPRNFVTKIAHYPKILSTPNSMTVLPTLLPLLADMIAKEHTGTINLVNPGVITHDEVLVLYRTHVDPTLIWENVDATAHDALLMCKRSCNQLCTKRLQDLYPEVPPIHEAVAKCVACMAKETCS
jgi:dTDP-4-dehydrorhamnose reductase